MVRRRLKDKEHLDPNDPFEHQLMIANELVHAAMKDKDFRDNLNELRAEALSYRGMSVGKNMKHKYSIPSDAYYELPHQFYGDMKLQDEWVRYHHPYLVISRFWTIKGENRRFLSR